MKYNVIILSSFMLLGLLPTVTAEDMVLMRQNFDKEWVEVHVPTTPAAAALKKSAALERVSSNLVSGGITFNITYEDAANTGFNDPTTGADRRATLEAVLTYVGTVLDVSATIDVVCEASVIDPGSSTLASAGTYFNPTGNGFKDGLAAQHLITGTDPTGSYEDIFVTVNFGRNWNNDLSAPSGGEFDLYSVLLHEISHGLGFTSLITATGVGALSGNSRAFSTFDKFVFDSATTRFIDDTTFDPVGQLSDLTSGSCYFRGPQAMASAGQQIPLNTPFTFSNGSSISHWDSSFNATAVMNPAISTGVSKRFYSEVELYALADLGYTLFIESDLELSVSVPSNANTLTDTDYTVTVTNNGPFTATGVEVDAPLPANTTYDSDDGGGNYTNGTGVWDIGTLAIGATATLIITHQLDQVGTFAYQADVSASDLADPDSTVGNGPNAEDDYDSASLYSGFIVSKTEVDVAEDLRTESFTVVLNGDPGGTPVVIELSSDDDGTEIGMRLVGGAPAGPGPLNLTFSTGDWQDVREVDISGLNDTVIDGTKSVTITLDVIGGTGVFTALADKTVIANNEDDGESSAIYADEVIAIGTVQLTNISNATFSVSGNATGTSSGNDWSVTMPLDVDGNGDAVLEFSHSAGTVTVPINVSETIVPLGAN